MALIKCKECGHQVSSQAKTCPNCGVQVTGKAAQEIEEVVKWAVAGVALVLVLLVAASSVMNTPGDRQAREFREKSEQFQREQEARKSLREQTP